MESLTESGPEPMKSPAMAVVLERLRAIGTLDTLRILCLCFPKGTQTNIDVVENRCSDNCPNRERPNIACLRTMMKFYVPGDIGIASLS